jgi:hypothetical protein
MTKSGITLATMVFAIMATAVVTQLGHPASPRMGRLSEINSDIPVRATIVEQAPLVEVDKAFWTKNVSFSSLSEQERIKSRLVRGVNSRVETDWLLQTIADKALDAAIRNEAMNQLRQCNDKRLVGAFKSIVEDATETSMMRSYGVQHLQLYRDSTLNGDKPLIEHYFFELVKSSGNPAEVVRASLWALACSGTEETIHGERLSALILDLFTSKNHDRFDDLLIRICDKHNYVGFRSQVEDVAHSSLSNQTKIKAENLLHKWIESTLTNRESAGKQTQKP